jgi:peptide/nickel transport system permease protein
MTSVGGGGSSGGNGFLARFARNRLALLGAFWLLLLLICFFVPGLVATQDPHQQDVTLIRLLETPSGEHWLGTDGFGRDTFSRVVWGGRMAVGSILIGLGLSAGIGIPLGLVSGWRGGWFDRIVMWLVDVLFSLPLVLLAMAIVAVAGTGLVPAMVAVGFLLSTRFARLTRSVTLSEREELYVDAARITGLSTPTILRRYIMPNLLPALIVQVAVISGVTLLIGAVLSFIGVGSDPTGYDWGAMLNQARGDFLLEPWQIVPPASAIVLTVLSFNLVGDAVRDAIGRDASSSALARVRSGSIQAGPTPHAPGALLSVRDLSVSFPSPTGGAHEILTGVSIDIASGETLGLVGESGSGKSMTLLSALGLVPAPGRITAGSVRFDGRDVTNLSEREWQAIRGDDIGMVFQEPIAVLNPALTIGAHLLEPLLLHTDLNRKAARQRALELLAMVRVPDPERRLDEYPHQMSGGMAQRVGIAMALACEPKLLIADEPTTALDVTVQGQILDLLFDLRSRLGMTMVIVTHDLGVVAEVADRVAVLYAGQVVEVGTAPEVFTRPRHPYTEALLDTMPQNHRGGDELTVIPGMVPVASAWPSGCRFHTRCRHAADICRAGVPGMVDGSDGHVTRCARVQELIPVAGVSREVRP